MSEQRAADASAELYARLGARPLVNARGHNTVLGGSVPSPAIRAAVEQADRYYVDMKELLAGAGRRVAELIGCEAAFVTPGASAGLALGTAACMTGADLARVAALPHPTPETPQTVLLQAAQQFSYQHVVTTVGAQLQLVGDEQGTTAAQLDAALGAHVAAVLYPAHLEGAVAGTLTLDETIALAHRHDVPVLVDAAAQVHPIERFRGFTARGADLVAFSGKYFRAPNSTGFLCGRTDLVEAAVPQGFIGFETVADRRSWGRPLKLDRQEIVALVVALEEWLALDHDARLAGLEERCAAYASAFDGVPGTAWEVVTVHASSPRVLRVTVDAGAAPASAEQIQQRLAACSPSIAVNREGDVLLINPGPVDQRDDQLVIGGLRAALAAGVSG
ncbi:MAG: aminotransferase class V-fold PLP-dependent enzyme [Conexibacter sp.]